MLANFNHLSQNDIAQLPLGNVVAYLRRRAKSSNPCNDRNQQYSIVGLTNAAGTLVERYTYTAYGTLGIYAADGTVRTTSSYNNRYTYTGREYDPDLKLYHFRARWYDPATGGFISRDPLGYVDGMSLYRGYFGVSDTDSSGTLSRIPDNKTKPGDNPWNQIMGAGNLLLPKSYECECTCSFQCSAGGGNVVGCSKTMKSVVAFGYSSAVGLCSRKCSSKNFMHSHTHGFHSQTCKGRLKGSTAACSLLDNYCLSLPFVHRIRCLAEARELCKCLNRAYALIAGLGVHGNKNAGGYVCVDCSQIFFDECFYNKSFRYFRHAGQGEVNTLNRPFDWLPIPGILTITHGHKWDMITGVHIIDDGRRVRPGTKHCAVMTVDYFNGAPKWDWYSPIPPPDWWGPGQNPFSHTDSTGPVYPDYVPGGTIW